jgi:hypothetical protein
MSPHVEAVTQRLEQTWVRWWLYSLLASGVLAICLAVGLLLVFAAVDAVLQLSQGALWGLFIAWILVAVALAVGLFFRHLQGRRSLIATARRVEMECPDLGSHLINLVQLASVDGQNGDPGFVEAAVAQAAEAVRCCPFEQSADRETRWRRFLLCMQTPRDLIESVAVLCLLASSAWLLATLVPRLSSAADRLFHPWSFVPSVGEVKIVEVTPGDTKVLVGTRLEVVARIDNPEATAYNGTLFVRREGEPETALPLAADEKNEQYTASLLQVLAPLRYRLQIGDSQTPLYRVDTCEKPTVEQVEITYNYPAYLGRTPDKVTQKQADLDGPQFTMADLKIRSSAPITEGYVMVEGLRNKGSVGEDGRTLNSYVFMHHSTTFTIHLVSEGGGDSEPRVNQVRVVTDAPPMVQLLEPTREANVALGGTMPLVVRAGDDYGLGQVEVQIKSAEDAPAAAIASWTSFPSTPSVVLRQEYKLDVSKFKQGQILFVRARARDRREHKVDTLGIKLELAPQEATSVWHQVRVVAPEEKARAELAQLEELRAALAKILAQQVKARVDAARLSKESTVEAGAKLALDIRGLQVDIQKATVEVVVKIGKPDSEERLNIKKAANKLAFGEMLEAVRQAEALTQLKALPDLAKPSAALMATQDRIIDVLRRLLNEARRETAEVLAEMQKKPANDLPPDVQAKLRDMKDKLDEFLKQQKKVIDGTHDLAKTPVEDFTEKEEQKLKELAATEDDWSRFMKDRHSDLSKLPEQDFSNPSLLQELVEVQTQLKMAEDALTKKSADIAVPLEQLGAEMAKELTTNIEKWLPDTPDREKWSQEEPITDDMKEAPMAELPQELEDIVGDLMEGEEDLMDEMEDVSSSWTDSGDKGIGWDAMDGPISNNSAKGVTGNRLPNTSEIAGRSGEGRSGKSAGEFVGDEAVGKGGRKTETRLTPDAFQKGQIKDHSKDPTGGATGGGKESGVGGEGLQGPLADRPQRQMARLAQKQADLRNKAEAVDLQFKVMNYHHSDLRKLIEQMSAVENDLKAGRYQNALRRRQVLLEGLGQLKTYVNGEFKVRQDTTKNLPADIQKEILGSMQEPQPPGWEGLNRQYFERLGSSKDAAAPTPGSAKPAPVMEKK